MLVDADISRANVSKAKPLAPRPAIGHMHAGRRPQRWTTSGGVGGAAYPLQEAAAEEEGRRGVAAEERRVGTRSPPRRGGVAAEERRNGGGGVLGRTAASGTEMRGEGGRWRGRARRRRETALRACRGRVAWRVREERRDAARRVGGEDGASRKKGAIWGKTVKCPRGLYRTPTFCHGS
jgi:hypothetical protein